MHVAYFSVFYVTVLCVNIVYVVVFTNKFEVGQPYTVLDLKRYVML